MLTYFTMIKHEIEGLKHNDKIYCFLYASSAGLSQVYWVPIYTTDSAGVIYLKIDSMRAAYMHDNAKLTLKACT